MELAVLLLIGGGIIGAKWDWAVALLAFASGVWQRIRMAFNWLWGLVVVTNEVDWGTVLAVLAYMDSMNKFSRKKRGRNFYRSDIKHVRPLDKAQRVMLINRTHNDIVFFYKRRPVFYHYTSADDAHCTFSYIRGTIDWDALLWEVVQWEESTKKSKEECDSDSTRASRYQVTKVFGVSDDSNEPRGLNARAKSVGSGADDLDQWIPLHWKPEDIGESHKASSLDLLSLRPEQVDAIEEVRYWFDSEDWYRSRGIPWRRTMGFEGDPGTGKTSVARGIAEDLDIPIFMMDLASMNNRELNANWERATYDAPCMILLEDVDGVFDGRRNKSTRPDALTFDCLLNCIDGIKRGDGLLVVITSNHINRLDPAIRRPGRMDRIVHFQSLDLDGRIKIATRIVDDHDVAIKLAEEGENLPAAEFQERCFRVALEARFKAK